MSNTSGRSWPTKRLPDQFGAPSNAAVNSVPDLPKPRNSAAATSAMDILADAVWRIDARDHQNAGAPAKVVRNLGTAGSVLDCRTGSTSVPDTNDPLFLPAEQSAYVYLPGVNGNFLTVPNETALQITGDIDIRVDLAMDDWTPSATQILLAKANSVSTNAGYLLTMLATGALRLIWGDSGTGAARNVTSTVAVPATDGTRLWVRAVLDANNGATGCDVYFYTSLNGSTWTQLGTTVTTATVAAIGTSTAVIGVGSTSVGTASPTAAKVHRAQVIADPFGTPNTVLDVDTSVLTTGSATSFTAATGQTVTINRSTSGRKSVVVPSADVKKVDDANVYLPGVAGNSLSIPHVAGEQAGDTMDVRVDVSADSGNVAYAGKGSITGAAGLSWYFGPTSTNLPNFLVADGTTVISATGSTAPPVGFGGRIRLRATYTRNTGAGQYGISFYYSTDFTTALKDITSWTQFGSTITGASIGATSDLNQPMFVGAFRSSTGGIPGKYYGFTLDVGGVNKVNIDTSIAPTNFTPGQAAAFPAVTGQTVTMNSTSGSAMRVNGERFAAGSPVWLFGTDDYMEVPLSATGSKLLDFSNNDSFTALVMVREWATAPTSAMYLSKQNTSLSFGSYTISSNTGTQDRFTVSDAATNLLTPYPLATIPYGANRILVGTFNRATNTALLYGNNVVSSSSPVANLMSLTNPVTLKLGRREGVNINYADMEFVAAAIWRRALTAAEIQTLTTYYQSKVA